MVSFLFLAADIFRRDKIELVFDLNRSSVTSFASDVDSLFQSVSDKMKLVAVLSQTRRDEALMDDLFENESSIVFLSASYGFQKLDHTVHHAKIFSDTYNLAESYYLETLPKARSIPFDEIRLFGEVVWNATIEDGPPLIGFGRSVVPEVVSETGETVSSPFAIIAFIRADRLLKTFDRSRVNKVTIVNSQGEVLLHPDPDLMFSAKSMTSHPLFQIAKAQALRTGVSSFTDQGVAMLGAFSGAAGGQVVILSQTEERLAFSAVERLVRQSLLFAGIAITLAFLVAIFFSRSLTRPIHALVEAMKRVSEGEMSARIDVKSNDEIAALANSFNSMIGDLKTSREALEEANRDLEQKVRDRTKKLEEQNAAVKKAQEALLQSSRLAAVGEVAGRAAHEVLNPLTSILTRLEKIRMRVQHSATQEVTLVQDILKGWEKDLNEGGIERLVENWRAPSSIEASKSLWDEDFENVKHFESAIRRELSDIVADTDFLLREGGRINKIVQNMRSMTRVRGDLKTTSARKLMHDAVTVMADLCHDRNIQIEEICDTDQELIRVDSDEFIQVATNLLRNSIQAIEAMESDRGSGRIRIRISHDDGQVFIDIEDNGVGIHQEDKEKLFEVQFSTKDEEGTGLGLSISRRFIRAFGGDIVLLRSAPGEGCVFRISLPLADAKAVGKVAV